MDPHDFLAGRFEEHRGRLRGVAYRMLGSVSEAEDAVQETWIRLGRSDADEVENLGGWLTTVLSRVCLDLLRSRASRAEEPLETRTHVPDPLVGALEDSDPEEQALLADSVGLALLVVLETLTPAERLAFVLHDTFAVPFDDIAPMLGRTPAATRQLASRARRRVRGVGTMPDPDRQRRVVDAFLAASRSGDFEALLGLLDPEVTLRADTGAADSSCLIRGARAVANQAFSFQRMAVHARPALVNGVPGVLTVVAGRAMSVMDFTVGPHGITELNILADPDRLARLNHLSDVP
ncbi:sigma-70 family RNA polymerase sigma factor [Streptomyces iconiensis]|uniref:Sigma-70 family RNA polymerase sigma factor n=1 Tax=Streptomyces iconiensis TaxID=1384038 RepID=A0ABT6ZS86_9ACTN|nr:sigma-70 family RNA polymerase sigma factor [Streptomyces iconiensis]MDJ1131928.1 sigma-70 family RNA polymerase sigma factor [Streptomyces iconiensis]